MFLSLLWFKGKDLKNFGGVVGGKIEHDFIRNNRHTLTGAVGANQPFQRFEGQFYRPKPSYEVGVSYQYRF